MGGVEALDSLDEDWYIKTIIGVLTDHGIRDWDTGLKRIKDTLWFDCLFVSSDDRLARKVRAVLCT
jgi:hypothetical protein